MKRHAWIWPPIVTLVLFVLVFAPTVLAPPSGDNSNTLVVLLLLAVTVVIQALGFWSGWLYKRVRPAHASEAHAAPTQPLY